ncbi:MAG: DUF2007 domain-containing protein [Hyphomicrobiaceae bacterium]|nr:DUF2007 domain-containing protein [Hyphomicrobiaceae bacterium]
MKEVVRTNDPVLLSFVEVLLRDAGIPSVIADQNMSVLEGSIGVLPRRLLVADEDFDVAMRVMADVEQLRQEGDDGGADDGAR